MDGQRASVTMRCEGSGENSGRESESHGSDEVAAGSATVRLAFPALRSVPVADLTALATGPISGRARVAVGVLTVPRTFLTGLMAVALPDDAAFPRPIREGGAGDENHDAHDSEHLLTHIVSSSPKE